MLESLILIPSGFGKRFRALLFKETLYRISRAEDALEESRRETLELAEAKAALERELNTLRMQAVEGLDGTAIAG